MKKTANLTWKTLCIYLALLTAFCLLYSRTNAQDWKPNPKYTEPAKDSNRANSVQCWGTTKKGERCKMKGQPNADDKFYCYHHITQK